MRWTNTAKAAAAGFAPNSLYKKQWKLTGNSGRPLTVTVHNTADPETDVKARDNGARLAAWLLWKRGLDTL